MVLIKEKPNFSLMQHTERMSGPCYHSTFPAFISKTENKQRVSPNTPEVRDDSDGNYPFYHIPLLSIIWSDSPALTELKKTILLCNE